jgi:hypothetical protein
VGNVLVGLVLALAFLHDCQIYYSFHPDDIDAALRTVNEVLMAIQRWALDNGLFLNASKTQVLLCGSPHMMGLN